MFIHGIKQYFYHYNVTCVNTLKIKEFLIVYFYDIAKLNEEEKEEVAFPLWSFMCFRL